MSTYIEEGAALMPSNPFGGRNLYINLIQNALFQAVKRYTVSGSLWNASGYVGEIPQTTLAKLFDGNYDNTVLVIPSGQTAKISITGPLNMGVTYPYGNFYVSYYYDKHANSGTARVLTTGGWQSLGSLGNYVSGTYGLIQSGRAAIYNVSGFGFDIQAKWNQDAYITQIEWKMDRPTTAEMPYVDKYRANDLYEQLSISGARVLTTDDLTSLTNGYVLSCPSSATNNFTSTGTYYFGFDGGTALNQTFENVAVEVPRDGTIKRLFVKAHINASSTGLVQCGVRVNSTSHTGVWVPLQQSVTTTGIDCNIAVSAGDLVALKAIPTGYPTPLTGVKLSFSLYIE